MRTTRLGSHLVVPPVGMDLEDLEYMPHSYFPVEGVGLWFEHSEDWRKERIREMWEPYCAISGEPSREVPEIIPQGMGERVCTLVPWNMIVLSHFWHMLVQGNVVKIDRFDPLGRILEVTPSRAGLKLPSRLWFTMPTIEREKRKGAVQL